MPGMQEITAVLAVLMLIKPTVLVFIKKGSMLMKSLSEIWLRLAKSKTLVGGVPPRCPKSVLACEDTEEKTGLVANICWVRFATEIRLVVLMTVPPLQVLKLVGS